MDTKSILISELIKNGYSEKNGNRVWHMANRSLLYLTPEMSKTFLKLLDFEPYKKNVFEVEIDLIRKNAPKFLEALDEEPFNFVDIGCGNGTKAVEVIKSLKGNNEFNYFAISSGEHLSNLAVENVKSQKFKNLKMAKSRTLDYYEFSKILKEAREKGFKKNLILLHGSILASYEINDFLFELKESMEEEDYVIIGNSIRTGERLQGIEKYKNPIFIEWFEYLINYLGFEKEEVEYDARFNEKRFEGIFKIKKDKKIKDGEKEIEFKEGDELLVAVLYKYYEDELCEFLKMYFSEIKTAKDENEEYMLAFCKKK